MEDANREEGDTRKESAAIGDFLRYATINR
jgi:hypothetical protein